MTLKYLHLCICCYSQFNEDEWSRIQEIEKLNSFKYNNTANQLPQNANKSFLHVNTSNNNHTLPTPSKSSLSTWKCHFCQCSNNPNTSICIMCKKRRQNSGNNQQSSKQQISSNSNVTNRGYNAQSNYSYRNTTQHSNSSIPQSANKSNSSRFLRPAGPQNQASSIPLPMNARRPPPLISNTNLNIRNQMNNQNVSNRLQMSSRQSSSFYPSMDPTTTQSWMYAPLFLSTFQLSNQLSNSSISADYHRAIVVPEHTCCSAYRSRKDLHCCCCDVQLLSLVPSRKDHFYGSNETSG